MSKWVSVEDKKPSYYKTVLVYTKSGEVALGYVNQWEWYTSSFKNELPRTSLVTHWQPLPEPPED